VAPVHPGDSLTTEKTQKTLTLNHDSFAIVTGHVIDCDVSRGAAADIRITKGSSIVF
jgi:hypothetical protein